MAQTPIGSRDPNASYTPVGDLPADPQPGGIFESPTVFNGYEFYRRLIPTSVYLYENGQVKTVNVVNTRKWHFFRTGRVLVRFTNHRAGVL